MCPRCGRNTPVVLRGLRVTCAVCGALRPAGDAVRAVNVAGRPSRFGGELSRVLGWVTLVGGLTIAALVGGLAQMVAPGSMVGLVVGVPIALLAVALSVALFLGGRRLRDTGTARTRSLQVDAIQSLAAARGGEVSPDDVARALDMPVAEADALLTELAKHPDAGVQLDVDDDGRLHYRFEARARRFDVGPARLRVRDDELDEQAALEAQEAVRARHAAR